MSRPARGLALLLATVLLLAPVLPFAAVGGAAAAPAGMSTIPDANVAADVPAGETIPLSASELEGGVMASQHADSLSVTLTTADHAASVMDADSAVVSGDGMAVVLRDDQQSAGREVALDAGLLQQALGYRPEAIYGTHEDGSTWTASAEYVDGYLVFDVPHFSSNTVTFSGEVTIDASGATNGTQFEYDVGQDNVTDASIDLTGALNTEQKTVFSTDIQNGETLSVDIGGNTDPPSAEITLTGERTLGGDKIWESDYGAYDAQDVEVNGRSDRVFSADTEGFLRAYYASNGSQIWKSEDFLNNQKTVGVHESRNLAFTGGYGNSVHSVFGNNGSTNWEYYFGDRVYGMTVGESTDTVYAAGDPNDVHAIDVTTGTGDWTYTGHSGTVNDVAVDESSGTVYSASDDNELHAISASGGSNDWTYTGHSSSVFSVAVDESTDTVYSGDQNGNIYAIDPSDQSHIWTYSKKPGRVRDLVVDESKGILYSANGDGTVHAINASDGTQLWSYSGINGDAIGVGLNESDEQIYAADDSGTIVHSVQRTIPGPTDPGVDVDGDGIDEASYSGELDGSHTDQIDLTLSDDSWTVSTTDSAVNVTANISQRTVTKDPVVQLNSDEGTQTLSHTGTLADDSTVDLSNEIDESMIGGSTTVSVTVDDPASGPAAQVGLNYSHSAQDKISTNYQASTFEETYNISHTYSDATENAQATIPFASSRVVGVKNVEYRVDGGSWSRVAPANYRLDGTTLDVHLDDATGGVSAGQTVGVRATGRKISVDNGKVTVTDPTAPGEELDTELRVDSRQPDFAVNVGPTDDGDRVHYAYSPYFPTEDYVIIQADGDQDLHLPNAVTGDRFRVRHLDTRVVAERGDVRIDVVEAGENPELDVSPGPGGSGDPVTVEYYNTETGVKYLLNSLTRSIVVDSDVAESPAIFEDDDSEDTWAILTDAGPSGTSSSSGAVGQFTERASGAVGSVSLPVDGSGLGQLALVGVLGLGGLLVLRRFNPFGGSSDSDSAAVTSSTSTGSASGPTLDRLTGLASTAGAVGSRAAQTTGSGLLAALRRLLAYFGQVATLILGNRRASITAGVVAAIVAARVGLVSLPEGTGILIVVAGVPVATWLILRQNNAASTRVWLGSTIAAVILGLEFVAPGTVQTAIEQLTSETVAPLLILVAAGGLYLWYRARQSDRPQIIIGGDSE